MQNLNTVTPPPAPTPPKAPKAPTAPTTTSSPSSEFYWRPDQPFYIVMKPMYPTPPNSATSADNMAAVTSPSSMAEYIRDFSDEKYSMLMQHSLQNKLLDRNVQEQQQQQQQQQQLYVKIPKAPQSCPLASPVTRVVTSSKGDLKSPGRKIATFEFSEEVDETKLQQLVQWMKEAAEKKLKPSPVEEEEEEEIPVLKLQAPPKPKFKRQLSSDSDSQSSASVSANSSLTSSPSKKPPLSGQSGSEILQNSAETAQKLMTQIDASFRSAERVSASASSQFCSNAGRLQSPKRLKSEHIPSFTPPKRSPLAGVRPVPGEGISQFPLDQVPSPQAEHTFPQPPSLTATFINNSSQLYHQPQQHTPSTERKKSLETTPVYDITNRIRSTQPPSCHQDRYDQISPALTPNGDFTRVKKNLFPNPLNKLTSSDVTSSPDRSENIGQNMSRFNDVSNYSGKDTFSVIEGSSSVHFSKSSNQIGQEEFKKSSQTSVIKTKTSPKSKTEMTSLRRQHSGEPDIFVFPDVTEHTGKCVDEVDGDDLPMDLDDDGSQTFPFRQSYNKPFQNTTSRQYTFGQRETGSLQSNAFNFQSSTSQSFGRNKTPFENTNPFQFGFGTQDVQSSISNRKYQQDSLRSGTFNRECSNTQQFDQLSQRNAMRPGTKLNEPAFQRRHLDNDEVPNARQLSSHYTSDRRRAMGGSTSHYSERGEKVYDDFDSSGRGSSYGTGSGPQSHTYPSSIKLDNRGRIVIQPEEILDNSEPEGVVHIIGEDDEDHAHSFGHQHSSFNQQTAGHSISHRWPSSSNNGFQRGLQQFEDEEVCVVRTRADTNVSYVISLSELSGSSSSGMLDDSTGSEPEQNSDCIPSPERRYRRPWDETDGMDTKNTNLSHTLEPVQTSDPFISPQPLSSRQSNENEGRLCQDTSLRQNNSQTASKNAITMSPIKEFHNTSTVIGKAFPGANSKSQLGHSKNSHVGANTPRDEHVPQYRSTHDKSPKFTLEEKVPFQTSTPIASTYKRLECEPIDFIVDPKKVQTLKSPTQSVRNVFDENERPKPSNNLAMRPPTNRVNHKGRESQNPLIYHRRNQYYEEPWLTEHEHKSRTSKSRSMFRYQDNVDDGEDEFLADEVDGLGDGDSNSKSSKEKDKADDKQTTDEPDIIHCLDPPSSSNVVHCVDRPDAEVVHVIDEPAPTKQQASRTSSRPVQDVKSLVHDDMASHSGKHKTGTRSEYVPKPARSKHVISKQSRELSPEQDNDLGRTVSQNVSVPVHEPSFSERSQNVSEGSIHYSRSFSYDPATSSKQQPNIEFHRSVSDGGLLLPGKNVDSRSRFFLVPENEKQDTVMREDFATNSSSLYQQKSSTLQARDNAPSSSLHIHKKHDLEMARSEVSVQTRQTTSWSNPATTAGNTVRMSLNQSFSQIYEHENAQSPMEAESFMTAINQPTSSSSVLKFHRPWISPPTDKSCTGTTVTGKQTQYSGSPVEGHNVKRQSLFSEVPSCSRIPISRASKEPLILSPSQERHRKENTKSPLSYERILEEQSITSSPRKNYTDSSSKSKQPGNDSQTHNIPMKSTSHTPETTQAFRQRSQSFLESSHVLDQQTSPSIYRSFSEPKWNKRLSEGDSLSMSFALNPNFSFPSLSHNADNDNPSHRTMYPHHLSGRPDVSTSLLSTPGVRGASGQLDTSAGGQRKRPMDTACPSSSHFQAGSSNVVNPTDRAIDYSSKLQKEFMNIPGTSSSNLALQSQENRDGENCALLGGATGSSGQHIPSASRSGHLAGQTSDVTGQPDNDQPAGATGSPKRPRQDDEVDIHVEVSAVVRETRQLGERLEMVNEQVQGWDCECARVERQILATATDMFRRLSGELHTRQNWHEELRQTNEVIRDALEVATSLRQLCRHGRRTITDVLPGSVIFRVKCRTLTSVLDLCEMQKSGDMQRLFACLLITERVEVKKHLTLRVTLDSTSVKKCVETLASRVSMHRDYSTPKAKRSPQKKTSSTKRVARSTENLVSSPLSPRSPKRCSSTPVLASHSPMASPLLAQSPATPTSRRERKFSFSDVTRMALQELNISDTESLKSPGISPYLSTSWKEEFLNTTPTAMRVLSPGKMTSPRLRPSPSTSPLPSPRRLSRRDVIQEQENME